MPVPQEILKLVERFDSQHEAYQSGKYNEAQIRAEFIDPLFKALGWDIHNEKGYAEAYKDVIHEDAIKIGGATEAPDLCFRIGGTRKFFVECKKPSVNIKDDVHPAYQLRRYAWSARLPLSILTDFDELAVYDCRAKPNKNDTSAIGRLMYFTSNQFAEKWDEFAAVFSREAVLKGSFDKFAEGTKGKKGTANVDDAFLEEIERWRDMLARNIAMRNEKLSQRELNFSVQRIIDRIIFLRICEDRGIEPYGRLMTLRNGERAYPRLCEFFQRADERYNSGLFHFQREKDRPEAPDELTLSLKIDDTVLKDIVGNLYYPESPYEFSVLPADILGQVYERFLGKVIRLTAGHQAKVEDKPEVRKAGGVYYTPTYIVDYIVKNTVGKLLEGKTPRQTAKLKILDPACGSGSFLLGAYQLLLDWHLVQYMKKPENWTKGREPKLYQHHKGGWKLTTAERKRILLNNIYGVDIDSQAVEVTKLSLLLKVLEGESQETITKQFELFHQRALPDLGSNIKCGNSLIGPDFYKDRQGELFGEDEMFRINIFDWNAEFSEIMKNGGFDTVIGNPPYLNVDDTWGKGDSRLAALKKLYSNIYNDKTDILFYFLGKAIQLSKGYICFIVSRAFLEAYKADKLRTYLLLQSSIQEVIDFRNFHVFYGVGITTCIITLRRNSKPGIIQAYKLLIDVLPSGDLQILRSNPQIFEQIEISQNSLCSSAWVMVSSTVSGLNEKIDRMGDPLNKILIIGQGMQTGQNDVFGKRTLKEVTQWRLKPGQFYKRASNSDIQRYFIQDRGEYIFYPQIFTNIEQLPKGVQKHLLANVVELKGRAAYKRGDCEWWKFTWPLHEEHYNRHRIICPYLASSNRFALDTNKEYLSLTDTTVLFENKQQESLLYLLGLLNSRLLTFRFRSIGKLKGGSIYEYFWNSISKLPIRRINFSDPADKARHDKMVALVDHMLDLHKKQATAKTDHERTLLERQISATDREIDLLVYELYGLTASEITIVEGAVK